MTNIISGAAFHNDSTAGRQAAAAGGAGESGGSGSGSVDDLRNMMDGQLAQLSQLHSVNQAFQTGLQFLEAKNSAVNAVHTAMLKSLQGIIG